MPYGQILTTTKTKFETIGQVLQNKPATKTVKNTKEQFLKNIFIAYVVASFGIFIIPEDILSSCKICRDFVAAMKHIFPNIQIFSDVSTFKQKIEFYTSHMWVIGLLWATEMVFYTTCRYAIFVDKGIGARESIDGFTWKLSTFILYLVFMIYVYYGYKWF